MNDDLPNEYRIIETTPSGDPVAKHTWRPITWSWDRGTPSFQPFEADAIMANHFYAIELRKSTTPEPKPEGV